MDFVKRGNLPPSSMEQTGSVALTTATGQGPYTVTFTPALNSIPSFVDVQCQTNGANGTALRAYVDKTSITASSFSFNLDGVPTDNNAVAEWIARI